MNASSNNIMKVDDIKSMISTFSLQEIYNSFMSTIDCIFNTDNTDNYWDLTSKISYKSENDKIYNFLSPNGQLFDLILKRLTVDKSVIHFEFPIQKLSNYTQLLISNNSAPTFISSKLNTKTHDLQNAVLYLNAFEYYMFSFASYIYHPNIIKRAEWNGSTDSIYCQLLLRYFDFFFFNSRESCSLMQLALQSRSRSNFNQSFSWISPHFQYSQQNLSINLSNSPSEIIMLNRSRFAASRDTKNVDIAELYYTETVLQTISEFWLNPVVIIDSPSVLQRIITRPTVDQVCLVRSLVKHCYHFSFAKSISTLSPDCQLECEFLSKLHFYRQQIVPKFITSKMLAYLETCFRTWPIDLSFRIVMETWLSVVQPWRYVDSYQHPIEHDTSLTASSPGALSISDEWGEFVAHNPELYCVLLLQFVHRLQRMDLAVARNAHMMFRVAKILSHADLVRFLARRSESRFRNDQTVDSAVWQEIRHEISIVFVEIASVLARLDDLQEASEKGWWRTFWEFLNSDSLQASDPKRVKIYLNQSRSMFANLLGIDCGGEEVSRVAERHDFLDAKNHQAEHVITSRGAELTEFGRFQVANKLCKLSGKSKIYYYNRPTCSFEVDALVRLSRNVSNLVCSRYEDQLRASCYRGDFWGRLCRYVLIGESRPLSAPGNDDDTAGQLKQWVDEHPLHLRLRFLTTKAFLFWFFIIYLLIRLTLGLGMVPIVIGGCALYVLVGIVSVVILGFQ